MRKVLMMVLLGACMLFVGMSEAVETKLVIRAKSKDAKFIGTSMGGARVVIKEGAAGKVLAEGVTAGGTGDTRKIMMEPRTRFGQIATGAAGYETSLDINEPTLVTIEVEAPYASKDNMIKSTTQLWLIPGKDITGEGIIIEVPGFSVTARVPESAPFSGGKAAIPVEAGIVMI